MADDDLLLTRDPITRKTKSVHRTPPSNLSDVESKVGDWAMGVDPTPSTLAQRKFGSIDDDIDLPKETAKPAAVKPITNGRPLYSDSEVSPGLRANRDYYRKRSLAGGKR